MAIGPVITRGYGSFGTVNLVVTRGYSAGVAAADAGTHCVDAMAVYVAGAEQDYTFMFGADESDIYVAGSERSKVGCH